MNTTSTTIQRTPGGRKLIVHSVLSLLTVALGVALLLYMILVEDEPGAVPLGLIAAGIGWFLFARSRLKPRAGRDAAAR